MPWDQKAKIQNRTNMATNSMKTLKMVHIKICFFKKCFHSLLLSVFAVKVFQQTWWWFMAYIKWWRLRFWNQGKVFCCEISFCALNLVSCSIYSLKFSSGVPLTVLCLQWKIGQSKLFYKHMTSWFFFFFTLVNTEGGVKEKMGWKIHSDRKIVSGKAFPQWRK